MVTRVDIYLLIPFQKREAKFYCDKHMSYEKKIQPLVFIYLPLEYLLQNAQSHLGCFIKFSLNNARLFVIGYHLE